MKEYDEALETSGVLLKFQPESQLKQKNQEIKDLQQQLHEK